MARNLNVPGFFAFRIRPVELAIAGGATLATATLLSSFGRFWWFFDLFTHFRVQLFLGLLGIALVLLLARRIAPAFAFALIALVNLWVIVPCYLGKEMMVQSNSHLYRGLLVNVNRGTGDPQKVARLIESTAPDIVALEEVDELWLAAISRSVAGYKYNRTVP